MIHSNVLLLGEGQGEEKRMEENPDLEVIVEALKSICNILLHNETGQVGLLSRRMRSAKD